MNKGIVFKIERRGVIILTPNGEFVACKKKLRDYVVGQEIVFSEEERQTQRASRLSFPFVKPVILTISCLLCAFLFFYYQKEQRALAYVAVDINPSVEASVDNHLRVINLEAYNADGKRIVKELKGWKGEALSKVIQDIVSQSQKDGYLTKDKKVTLTSIMTADSKKDFETQLKEVLVDMQAQYESKNIPTIYQEGTLDDRNHAQKSGLSTGNYIKKEREEQMKLSAIQEDKKPEVSETESSVEKQEQPKEQGIQQSEQPAPNENKPAQQKGEVPKGTDDVPKRVEEAPKPKDNEYTSKNEQTDEDQQSQSDKHRNNQHRNEKKNKKNQHENKHPNHSEKDKKWNREDW
ncbi:anti-sigma factor domain-containing protein [Microbacteriaceae bacterium 4G12]